MSSAATKVYLGVTWRNHAPFCLESPARYCRHAPTVSEQLEKLLGYPWPFPDQKRQGEAYCASRGYQLVETYVEPGASATNDRRPEFQRMIEAGTSKPAPFSRFLKD